MGKAHDSFIRYRYSVVLVGGLHLLRVYAECKLSLHCLPEINNDGGSIARLARFGASRHPEFCGFFPWIHRIPIAVAAWYDSRMKNKRLHENGYPLKKSDTCILTCWTRS